MALLFHAAMTADEADQRIILSRRTLNAYAEMAASGLVPTTDMGLVVAEIDILEEIAKAHPVKAAKLENLVRQWGGFLVWMRRKLN